MKKAGQRGPEDDRSTIRGVLSRDLVADASTLAKVTEECGRNSELPENEAELASRVEAWAVQLQLIARSNREALEVEANDPPGRAPLTPHPDPL